MVSTKDLRPDVLSVEVSGSSITVNISRGTLDLWFGRHAEALLVARLLKIVAKVDGSAEHERVVFCSFEEISEFEAHGFVLTSYARKGEGYRAIFVVPFSKERALESFLSSLMQEIRQGEVKLTVRWSGGFPRIKYLCQELDRLNYFTTFVPTYKTEQSSGRPVS